MVYVTHNIVANMGSEMPRVDMSKEFANFTDSDKFYIRKLENLNSKRAADLKHLRRNSRITGLTLGAFAIGICILFFWF